MLAAAGGRSAAARRPPPEVEDPPLASRQRRSAAPSDDEQRLPRQAPATARASSRVVDMAGRRPASRRLCGTLEKARKAKRGSDITRSSGENRKDHETESLIFGHLHGDPNEDIWTGLSDDKKLYLSKSVISITLCDGNTNLFSCSGIAIDRQGNHLTSFLTSASLVKNLRGTPSKGYFNVKINVCDEGNEVHEGFLAGFDSDHNFAVVNVRTFLDVQCVLQHVLKIPLHGDALLVALGRNNSGELTTRTVKLSGNLRVSKDDKDCGSKISEAWDGGPLFSFDGSFVGMNLLFTTKGAFFLPWEAIFNHMERNISLAHLGFLKAYRFGARPMDEKSNIHLEDLNQEQLDLDSLGYPKIPSTMSDDHMILVNTFEETFGDIFCEGAWNKLSKRAASNIFRSVVALASFKGGKRFFACTGFFIKWNGSTAILTSASLVRNSGDEDNIVENLVIKVALPYNQFKEGKLQHFCLQYNVAIVSVMDYNARRPANGLVHWTSSEVAAVGRCYKTGALMATTGMVVPWSGTLDCEFLLRSSCKITKAGIGGPLVTLDGDVIGMNFYDIKIGTPFLSWEVICNILESFGEQSKAGEVGKASSWGLYSKDKLNRWPVPMPCWQHRDYVDEDTSDDDDVFKYTYINGEKFYMF